MTVFWIWGSIETLSNFDHQKTLKSKVLVFFNAIFLVISLGALIKVLSPSSLKSLVISLAYLFSLLLLKIGFP